MRIEHPLLVVLLFAVVGCQCSEDVELTPWFEVHYGRPMLDLPHMLQTGPYESEARIRLDGNWEVVSRSGRSLYAVPLDGGSKVLVQVRYGDWRIFSEGQREPESLSSELCPEHAYVSPDGQRIICSESPSHLTSKRMWVRALDTAGQRLFESDVEFPGPEDNAIAWVQLVGFLSEGVPVFATEFNDGDNDFFTNDCGLVGVDEGGPHILFPIEKLRHCRNASAWPGRVPELGLKPPLASSMER